MLAASAAEGAAAAVTIGIFELDTDSPLTFGDVPTSRVDVLLILSAGAALTEDSVGVSVGTGRPRPAESEDVCLDSVVDGCDFPF